MFTKTRAIGVSALLVSFCCGSAFGGDGQNTPGHGVQAMPTAAAAGGGAPASAFSNHTGVLDPVETPDGRLIPQVQRGPGEVYPKCLTCHGDIENATEVMGFDLDCVFCHGGDPDALDKETAHVQPTLPVIMDKTVPPLDYDLPYQRFINPSNLRVVGDTCGICHPDRHQNIYKGMMATAAGHYAGGLYQNGVQNTKTPIYGTFEVDDTDGFVPTDRGAVAHLDDLITYDPSGDPQDNATHFAAVPGQACARCHLWSRGKGYRGAENADGTYRADGCAACHMLYDNDGLSRSADANIDHTEKGHPRVHKVTRQIDTDQCIHCHHRGARIGLNFTGRAQMPPRLPSGPGVAGTTDERFNSNYHYSVDSVNPPDAHREAGLHCIDCHTANGIMGDGNIYGHMDQATKIECETCHGRPGEMPSLIDHDGIQLLNVAQVGDEVHLTSKVTGEVHNIPLAKNIVDPNSPDYRPAAVCAMNADHIKPEGGLECYACHSSWTANCFGCHFERDERFTGVNLVTRMEEVGRVRTNNKVFETFRPFFMGPNSEGRVAPYLVACQPIADVTAPDGSKILDFQMPTTSKGISGLALNPVQPHTVTGPGVRTCAECHRSPASLGMGTGNYSLARDYAYVAAPGGVRVYDRDTDPLVPSLVATLPVANPLGMVSRPDVVEGSADALYVAAGMDGLIGFDLEDGLDASPQTLVGGIDAIAVARVADYFYVVDQGVGVRVYDSREGQNALSDRVRRPVPLGLRTPRLVATVDIPTARRVLVWGIYLFVSAGNDGMYVVNIADQTQPVVEAHYTGINARDVRVYSHYQQGTAFAARAYVADPDAGVHVFDLLPDPGNPQLLTTLPLPGAVALDSYTAWVTGDAVTPSFEHDYLYVAAGAAGLHIFDMTDPDSVYEVAAVTGLGGSVEDVDVASQMSPPGVDDYAMLANADGGLQVVDVSDPTDPLIVDAEPLAGASEVFVEVQQMDRFLNEQGRMLKENSHPFVRNFTRADVVRILSASITDCAPDPGRPSPDFNGDGVVDLSDVAEFVRLMMADDTRADLTGDGAVDAGDIRVLLGAL
ncbi:MAG TPA: hypothetical protein ENK11_04760 [Phycisphaerales bacterium]|nr:hypothetical protein [Phycisphaerales bacterium]